MAEGPPNNITLHVVAVDDSCTSGSQICETVSAFNRLTEIEEYPFRPVTDVVTLFVVKDDETERNFLEHGLRLHALVSLGQDEMRRLRENETDELVGDINSFKQGYGCEASRRLAC